MQTMLEMAISKSGKSSLCLVLMKVKTWRFKISREPGGQWPFLLKMPHDQGLGWCQSHTHWSDAPSSGDLFLLPCTHTLNGPDLPSCSLPAPAVLC